MAIEMTEKEIYEAARKRVEEKKGFFVHLAAYVIINVMLILLWAFAAGGGYPWFIWPLGGWAVGLLFHFLGVFVFSNQTGWEKRAIEKEIEKIRHSG
ncbi:MAG: 2TM domain-containing protein [Dehalococcoidales bacterium]